MQSINQPRPSALAKGIFYVSFSLQHERSYHIVNKGNCHRSHSKRKLHAISKAKNKFFIPSQITIHDRANKYQNQKERIHTRCILAYITTGSVTGICKANSYMSTRKFIAHMNLSYTVRTHNELEIQSFCLKHL